MGAKVNNIPLNACKWGGQQVVEIVANGKSVWFDGVPLIRNFEPKSALALSGSRFGDYTIERGTGSGLGVSTGFEKKVYKDNIELIDDGRGIKFSGTAQSDAGYEYDVHNPFDGASCKITCIVELTTDADALFSLGMMSESGTRVSRTDQTSGIYKLEFDLPSDEHYFHIKLSILNGKTYSLCQYRMRDLYVKKL